MFFIVWGFRARKKKIGEGTFFCPREGGDRPYVHESARRWFTLYWIPLIPLKELGDYVECTSCSSTFYPNALNAQTNQGIEDVMTTAIRHVVVNILRADGVIHDSERMAAVQVVERFASRPYSTHDLEADLNNLNPAQLATNLEELGAALSEQGKESVLAAALLLSASDGHVDQSELDVARKIGEHLTMSEAHITGTISTTLEPNQTNPAAPQSFSAPPQDRHPAPPQQPQYPQAPQQQPQYPQAPQQQPQHPQAAPQQLPQNQPQWPSQGGPGGGYPQDGSY